MCIYVGTHMYSVVEEEAGDCQIVSCFKDFFPGPLRGHISWNEETVPRNITLILFPHQLLSWNKAKVNTFYISQAKHYIHQHGA